MGTSWCLLHSQSQGLELCYLYLIFHKSHTHINSYSASHRKTSKTYFYFILFIIPWAPFFVYVYFSFEVILIVNILTLFWNYLIYRTSLIMYLFIILTSCYCDFNCTNFIFALEEIAQLVKSWGSCFVIIPFLFCRWEHWDSSKLNK